MKRIHSHKNLGPLKDISIEETKPYRFSLESGGGKVL
jgi:hypothetical protein